LATLNTECDSVDQLGLAVAEDDAKSGNLYLAISGDLDLATSGDFFIATDMQTS
jgi:hypothetical protein